MLFIHFIVFFIFLEHHQSILCRCGRRTFKHKRDYKYHIKWECGQRMECHYCSKLFATRSHLLRHCRDCKYKTIAFTL